MPASWAICPTALTPLFLESAHTMNMIKYSMDESQMQWNTWPGSSGDIRPANVFFDKAHPVEVATYRDASTEDTW